MGCGCRKGRSQRATKIKAAAKKTFAARIQETAAYRKEKIKRKKIIETKLKFCRVCSHSLPTREERRNKTKVCHKASVSIQGIINNQKFKCPIGNF
jgi:hypothetical protein